MLRVNGSGFDGRQTELVLVIAVTAGDACVTAGVRVGALVCKETGGTLTWVSANG